MATLVAMTIADQMALKDVKNRLSEVVDQVEREHGRVVITKHGRPAAVVVSIDDLESLEETLTIMSKPRLVTQLRAASLACVVRSRRGFSHGDAGTAVLAGVRGALRSRCCTNKPNPAARPCSFPFL